MARSAVRLLPRPSRTANTLLLCTGSTHGGNAALMPGLPYDPIKDLAPVARLVATSGVVVVGAASPVRSLPQLIAAAAASPGALRYGAGSSYARIMGELFSRRSGVKLVHVPYKGDAQALTDLIGGHIDVLFSTPLSLLPQIKAGRIRALAIAGARWLPALPDVATTREQGLHDSELPAWAGICAPSGVASTIVERLNREALAAMTVGAVKAGTERQGYEVIVNTPAEFSAFIQSDAARVAALVKELGIPMEQ
jgi:tripartite-type tricarboxylate transporter receptor subunit TctC